MSLHLSKYHIVWLICETTYSLCTYLYCRKLYYTVWGGEAYIGSCSLDGSDNGPLFGPNNEIGWPNGLAIDVYGIYY